jgi:hypothetical protein
MTATTLILCSYRAVSVPTHHAIVRLMATHTDWSESVVDQAPINRARSLAASKWWRETDEDVFIMVDDDILFMPEDAVALAERCRNGCDVIGGGYPFRNGSSIAVRLLPGDKSLEFGSDLEPQKVMHIGSGFMAVHRRVLDAMIPTLPLCHQGSFWPMFDYRVVEDESAGGFNWLSEDYAFSLGAQELGFKVWLDRSILLAHLGQVPITVTNMREVHSAIKSAVPVPEEAVANGSLVRVK